MRLHRMVLRLLQGLAALPAWVVLVIWVSLAPTLSGTAPWTAEHVVLSSTTDWVVYTAPTWARTCLVKNEHATAVAYVGRYNETSTFDSTNDEYVTLPAGAALTIPLSAGTSAAPSDHLTIPVASAQASLPVGFYCTASPE